MVPSNLTAVAQTSTTVQLNWIAPSAANNTINYTIRLESVSFNGNSYNSYYSISTGSNATTFIVTYLVPCALYTLSMSASTMCSGSETGPYSDVLKNVRTGNQSMQ